MRDDQIKGDRGYIEVRNGGDQRGAVNQDNVYIRSRGRGHARLPRVWGGGRGNNRAGARHTPVSSGNLQDSLRH